MSVRARLVGFALMLVVMFAIGLGIGTAAGPLGTDAGPEDGTARPGMEMGS